MEDSDPTSKLVAELCSLLDEGLILSICGEYDVATSDGYDAARMVLTTLAETVEAEEATGFDPSGLGFEDFVDMDQRITTEIPGAFSGAGGDAKSNDGITTTTESSHALSFDSVTSSRASTLDSPDAHSGPDAIGLLGGLSHEDKLALLRDMFTSLKTFDIEHVLKKTAKTGRDPFEELLTLHSLEESGQRVRGIDAFFVADDATRPRKGKQKGKGKKHLVRRDKSTHGDQAGRDNAQDRQKDVRFLAERLGWKESDIQTTYNSCGKTVGATIVKIIDNYVASGIQSPALGEARNHMVKYPWVPAAYVYPLFQLADAESVPDLMKALADHFPKPASVRCNVAYNVVNSSQAEGSWNTATSSKARPTSLQSPRASLPSSPSFAPSRNEIDLHGYRVGDGVEEALAQVHCWWDNLGEYRAQKAKAGFTVITGQGLHNADGKSPLRINVFKALVADGWKMEVMTGMFLVTGRR